ncbi:hypothetical protein AB0K89_13900 [Streptomyces cinnamoneus]|uniref:hypothetical protein n=1 Tax=Streptomyces cinnamoneus TaxID=53446 RepID=UPI003421035F
MQELWENRDATVAALETGGIGAASALTVGGAAYLVLTRERRELMREWVVPLHEALAQPLGMAEQTLPRCYLHVPKNFSDDDAEIRVDLPTHLRFSRDLVAELVTQKLALEGVSFSWHPAGRKPYVLVKRAGGQGPGVRTRHRDRGRRPDRLRRPGRGVPAHPGQRLHRRRQVRDPACHHLPDGPPRRARLRPGLQADLSPVGPRRARHHLLR